MKNKSYFPSQSESSAIEVRSTALPELRPKEVLIEVKYFGINRADLMQINGNYPPPPGAPKSIGLECSGIIHAVGSDVSLWKVGDRVAALVSGGGYAHYCVADENLCFDFDNQTLVELAALPEAFISAYMALFWAGRLQNHTSILIHAGASGVGSAAIQLAKSCRCTVYTTSSGGKTEYCKSLGADIAIDYTSEDFENYLLNTMGIYGVDFILDFVGPDYWTRNINVLARDGQMVMLGLLSGFKTEESFPVGKIILNRLTIKGITLRSQRLDVKRKIVGLFLSEFTEAFEKGYIMPTVDSVFSWDEVPLALQKMRNNENVGKIICSTS